MICSCFPDTATYPYKQGLAWLRVVVGMVATCALFVFPILPQALVEL